MYLNWRYFLLFYVDCYSELGGSSGANSGSGAGRWLSRFSKVGVAGCRFLRGSKTSAKLGKNSAALSTESIF